MHGKVVVTLEGGSFPPSAMEIIKLSESTFNSNAEMPDQEQVSKYPAPPLSKAILGVFLEALVIPLSSLHMTQGPPCAGYDDGFSLCSDQLSSSKRQRTIGYHFWPCVS